MARWEPDARGRLVNAALDLFLEVGYEQTTVSDIAARAGVTERTFFRHFGDKREVLFGGSAELTATLVGGIAGNPPGTTPMTAVIGGFEDAAAMLQPRRDFSRSRARAIHGDPRLQERELLKLASLADAAAEALRARGVEPLEAQLASQTGLMVFKIGFDRWVDGTSSESLVTCMHLAFAELGSLARTD